MFQEMTYIIFMLTVRSRVTPLCFYIIMFKTMFAEKIGISSPNYPCILSLYWSMEDFKNYFEKMFVIFHSQNLF